jgi:hypothetical protein
MLMLRNFPKRGQGIDFIDFRSCFPFLLMNRTQRRDGCMVVSTVVLLNLGRDSEDLPEKERGRNLNWRCVIECSEETDKGDKY